jgi:hypothetical protein
MPATVRSRTGRTPADAPPPAKPRSDVWVGLLLIALLAQIAGGVFLYMDYSQYQDKKAPRPPKSEPAFQVTAQQPAGGAEKGGNPPADKGGNPPADKGGNPPADKGGNPMG